ncbi:MAG TPA: response regulator [Anaerolineae bacterium]|nr:response regulator [Anaerolineae bacterium]
MNERILIIDDDPDALTLIGLTLERRGYSVLKAAGGSEALMMIESDRPDLVLLDLMMPHMDGYEVCRRIKADPRLTGIPIVMLTAKAQMASQVEGYRVGADDYVTKPVHPDDLASHIHAVLERAKEWQPKKTGGRVVGVIGVKGGVGTTTVAVNVAVTLAAARRTILADFDAGGTAAIHLGFSALPEPEGLASLPASAIDQDSVAKSLVAHDSGLHFLPPANGALVPEQAAAIFSHLLDLCEVCVLDLGGGLSVVSRALLERCDLVLMALDSDRAAVLQAQRLLLALTELGVNRSRLRMVWANRSGLDEQAALGTLRAAVGEAPIHVVDPAAELAHRSVESGQPLVLSDPDSAAAIELRELGQSVLAALEGVAE